ncbi:MAG: NAD(P) transhydrogenase subunit alpha [Saprospiraceae bacterium]
MEQILNILSDIFPMVFILTLAILIGTEVISKVPTVLHTPLMSGANAISGVTIIGGILIVRRAAADEYLMLIIGTLAIIFAMLNVIGGFKVTDRMLAMFKKKK